MTVITYDNDSNPETALRNASLMVQDQPSVIIEYSPTPAIGAALQGVFETSGIPCIALNIPTPGCAWLNLDNKVFGMDNGKAALAEAQKRGWDGSNTTIILGGYPAAGEDPQDVVRYFYTTLADALPGYEKVAPAEVALTTTTIGDAAVQIDTGGNLEGAFAAMQAALQAVPEGRNIIFSAVNDDAALGGWQAISQEGHGETAIVVGSGGSAPALEQLRTNPSWVAEGSAFLSTWGYYALAMAAAVSQGATPPELTLLPQFVVTKENCPASRFLDTFGLG